ncbi:MAG: hypothetical protein A2Y17_03790 [Clostridiales bacterium GWF2_38_85]|nr:MAG: hypothetical protein A2Y17_03790 [Clostridiales bacterium GWF2_38_85]HBL83917.1 hypothetical protein [Clostridiales bacterium]
MPTINRIMLNAGHYSNYYNQGANTAYYESAMAWKLQGFLKTELERYGFEVDTTRTDINTNPAPYDRGYSAGDYDLYISLHSNAIDNSPSTRRVVVIHSYDNFNNSSVLGTKLCKNISRGMDIPGEYQLYSLKSEYGNYEAYLELRGARAAGCPLYYILEHGFHTNYGVSTWLLSDEHLQKLARIEAYTIGQYAGRKHKKGDINGNGMVDQSDVNEIMIMTENLLYGEPDDQRMTADMTFDGYVDYSDQAMAQNIVNGTYIFPYNV